MTKKGATEPAKKGAPAKAEDHKRKSFPMALSKIEKDRFTKYADMKGWSLASFFRTAADEYIRNHPE
jgi:hypothetical protein